MIKSNSILYNLYLDLKRGLSNKRFWSVLGVFSFIFILHIILYGIWPVTLYYFGKDSGINDLAVGWGGAGYTRDSEIRRLANLVLFTNFFPFIGAVAYAYTVIDDRRQRYCIQQVQRIGFSRYYWSKLIAGGTLGGLLGVFCMVCICLISTIFLNYNPFIREAIECYTEFEVYCNEIDNAYNYIGWGANRIYTVISSYIWWILGGIKYFMMGLFFGLLSSIFAFFSDNKVFMYAGPIIYLLLEDKWLYMLECLFGNDSYISMILRKFSFRSEMSYHSYGNLYNYALLIFLIVLLLNMARYFKNKAENLYMEGGNASD